MQDLYRDWHQLDQRKFEGVSVLSTDFEPFIRAQTEMATPFDTDELVDRAKDKVEVMKAIAVCRSTWAPSGCPSHPTRTGRSTRWR